MGAYNDDVLFVHIPKTGGTAVKHYMVEHMPDVRWPKPGDEKAIAESRLPIGHIPLRDVADLVGRPLSSWDRIVAVIRNPYEQQISQWWFWHKRYAEGDNHPHCRAAAKHPRIHSWLRDPMCDFHLWYEHRFHPHDEFRLRAAVTDYHDWGGYYWYWLSVNGELPPNLMILRQENLEHALPLALAPYIDGPPPEMRRTNAGEPMDLELVMGAGGVEAGAASMDIITRKFRWCFEHGYYRQMTVTE